MTSCGTTITSIKAIVAVFFIARHGFKLVLLLLLCLLLLVPERNREKKQERKKMNKANKPLLLLEIITHNRSRIRRFAWIRMTTLCGSL